MRQKTAYLALGFLVGWFFNRPWLWFLFGTGLGSLVTYLVLKRI